MLANISKVDVWAATIPDRPGGMAEKLDGLAQAGADLEFIIARRVKGKRRQGVLFVTPLKGPRQLEAARRLKFKKTSSLFSLRVEGSNEPGVGYLITRALAAAGINLRGVSAAVIDNRYVTFFAFDSAEDADKAMKRLKYPL